MRTMKSIGKGRKRSQCAHIEYVGKILQWYLTIGAWKMKYGVGNIRYERIYGDMEWGNIRVYAWYV